MKYLTFLFLIVLFCCKAQKNENILNEYQIASLVLKDFTLFPFILIDENYNHNLNFAFGAYTNRYKEYLKTGKTDPMVSSNIEWVLDFKDIAYISNIIKQDTIKVKWNKKSINHPKLIYASDHPDLMKSRELPRMSRVQISKAYLNKEKNKAVIFRIVEGHGYLILAKKANKEWVLCGKIEYMFS